MIYLGTVSKVFSPGVRVGWAVGGARRRCNGSCWRRRPPTCAVSQLNMLVTERYFAGDRWRRNLQRLVDIYRSRRDAMLVSL